MKDKLQVLAAKMARSAAASRALLVFMLLLGLAAGGVLTRGAKTRADSAAPGAAPLAIPTPAQLSSAFAQIAAQLRPSVVNINTESTMKQAGPRRGRPGFDGEDPFEQFFGPFGNPFGTAPRGNLRQRSLGSGIVVDRQGYILTNQHVVKGADRIQVKFADDPKPYEAKLIGSDSETDLAVIKVNAGKALAPAGLGNSDGMNVGDWVLAIGSPFSLEQTVTAGIISARNRDVGGSQFQHFLQTDAAINPGNSGGPLVNMAGQVIGINTMIVSNGGAWEGIGFALPSTTAIRVYDQIIKTGHVSRGSIGIQFVNDENRNPALLRALGVKQGVVVDDVKAGSPADKAGLKSGDVIVAVNGTPVKDGNDLVTRISDTPPGTTLRIQYARDGKTAETTVTVADRASLFGNQNAEEANSGRSDEASGVKFGLSLQELTPELAERLGHRSAGGVVVAAVEPNSFADDIGMVRGDVILEIQRQPVRSISDVRRIQSTLKPGQDVVFRVRRGGNALFLAGTLK